MAIWRTTPPTTQDYPIWAFTDDSEDVVLIRSIDDHQPTESLVTWCKADIPKRPATPAEEKFRVLRRSTATTGWLPEDWFLEGYKYGKYCKGTCGCDKGQSAKSPFVDPEEYFDDESETIRISESAFDERL